MADIETGGMVEKVARALCKHGGSCWETHTADARAAIEAMRDPPEYVLDAMNPSKRYASTVIPEAWNDAISAALTGP